ncbi:MAG: hypothetical protein JO345_34910 [Streptosporangiaceae bacterium]|nr:hypothetical protein [Streptosporangiaceae bacterium]
MTATQTAAVQLTPAAGGSRIPVATEVHIVPGTAGHGRARADALLEVVRVFGCRVALFGYNATRNDKFLVTVGTRAKLDALDILVPTVARRMEEAARAAVAGYAQRAREALPEMTEATRLRILVVPYYREYLRGFGMGAAEMIRAIRAEFTKTAGEQLAAIMSADEVRIAEKFETKFPDRQPIRPERTRHDAGREAGIAAGRMADIGDWYIARHDLAFAML